jgi:hypothetical protein
VEMKNTLFLALIILAVPASAQKAAPSSYCANGAAITALAHDYAARIDGMLRDVHASLQKISEGVEAGRLTPEQAQKLKLAATRDMIARLDALAAIYDVRLDAEHKAAADAGSTVAGDRAHVISKTSGTVSLQELKRESTSAVATTGPEEVAR